MIKKAYDSNITAFIGLAFALPFILLNTVVVGRIEPIYSIIRPDQHNSPFEYRSLIFILLLLPIGGFIAIRPVFDKVQGRKYYLVNIFVAISLFIGFTLIMLGLGEEIYKCEILKIPNCD